jgi:hypothetical protein
MPKVVKKVRRHSPRRVRQFSVGAGLPKPQDIRDELEDMRNVLLGRCDVPSGAPAGLIMLQEVADMFFGRACELEQLILEATAEGSISKTSPYHQIRTQEIRSFKDQAKSAFELGSRRITFERLLFDQETTGREVGR